MKPAGLWAANGHNPDIEAMLRLVGDGCYCCMWEGNGELQARAIRDRYAHAPILMRHHAPNWDTLDPAEWAYAVHLRMAGIRDVTRRVVGANEMNGEDHLDTSEARFRQWCDWYRRFAVAYRNWEPGAIIHSPAPLPGNSEDQNDHGYIGYALPEAQAMFAVCDRVNSHTYWDPADGPLHEMSNHGGGLRYRKLRQFTSLPIWIDEAGVWGEPWRVEQTAEHSRACARDGVEGVTYFLWADPTGANAFNAWHGRVPGDRLEWLRGEWAALAAGGGGMEVPDLAMACILATRNQLAVTADAAWHLAHGEDIAVDVAPLAGVGDLPLVTPWAGLVEFVGTAGDRGNNCGIVDIGRVYDMRDFGETQPWPDGGYDSWLEVGLTHVQAPIPFRGLDMVESGTLVGLMGWSGLVEPPGPAGRHLHAIIWLNRSGDLSFRHWRRIDPALLKRYWGA